HLFLARQTQRLRGEKSGDHLAASPHGHQCSDRRAPAARAGAIRATEAGPSTTCLLATPQRTSPQEPYENSSPRTRKPQHRPRSTTSMSLAIKSASSAEFVGEFWLGESSECVI